MIHSGDRSISESETLHPAKLCSHNHRWGYLLITLLAILPAISCAKRVDPAPKPQQPPPFEFLGTWGEKGNGPGKLNEPAAFAADSLGNVLFADPGANFVHKFEANGTPLLTFEDPRVSHAAGIAVDRGGAIYIADAQHGSVMIFFPDGTFLKVMHIAPQTHFSGPLGISVDDLGNLYVPEPSSSRVVKFDDRGRVAKFWRMQEGNPENPALSDDRPFAVATAPDGSVFVAYAKTGRIEKYLSDGSWVTSWIATENSAGAPGTLTGIAVTGQVVLTMSVAPPQIRVWTLDGRHTLDDDLGGRLAGVAAPQIAVTPHAELLVFDPSAPRVFRFRMHL
jgi:hypothetical protein